MKTLGPFTRKRLEGRMSDGSDHTEVTETFYVAEFVDDNGQTQQREFAQPPAQSDVDALTPNRSQARNAVTAAVSSWQTSQTAWTSATTVAQQLTALHLEHVALIRAIRALALLEQIDN